MPAVPTSKPSPLRSLLETVQRKPLSWQGKLFFGGSFLLNAAYMIRSGSPEAAALPLLVGLIFLLFPAWQ